jgi:uncharacterized FAD-dependent dehydrogenase
VAKTLAQPGAGCAEAFWQQGVFNPASNVQFGAGGAGTFSDGKLTTRVNDPVMSGYPAGFCGGRCTSRILVGT